MIRVEGYELTHRLATSSACDIYSAVRLSDSQPVQLRVLHRAYASQQAELQLRHESELARQHQMDSVLEVLDFVRNEDVSVLVERVPGGPCLEDYLRNNPIRELGAFLQLATKMTRALQALHTCRIIHKDIKPGNFIVQTNDKSVLLTGLSFSTELLAENQDVTAVERIEGTLDYMAPEQTGRMNKSIDYRSDFYALGVTFYEMIKGEKPFEFDDPLELLHAHLAGAAPALTNPHFAVPAVIESLISKLMAKNPFERYQSATGILHDLRICVDSWTAGASLEPFPLGKGDLVEYLSLSQELYGREQEKQALLEAYQRASDGAVEALLVGGYSGVGKTSLINEVHKPMVRDRGHFVSGKFDQLQRNVPYVAFRQAFNHLARTILSEDEQYFLQIKKALSDALGNVGQVIIDISPDFELILGKQPALEALPPQETQNRLQRYFKEFLRTVASPEHPLLIFLDDLQWADSGSLRLLECILRDEDLSHILLLGAYRSNEVPDSHILALLIRDCRAAPWPLHTLSLDPLDRKDSLALFVDSFKRDEDHTRPLAEILHKRTAGNPFFLKQVIRTLYKKGLLFFDREQHRWDWNLEDVEQYKIPDSVVGLLIKKLDALPSKTIDLLKVASCIGNSFDLATLEAVSQMGELEIREAIWIALKAELLTSTDLSFKYQSKLVAASETGAATANPEFQFLHDRIQESAYQTSSSEQRKQSHLRIADYLLNHFPQACQAELLFDLTDHLNKASELISQERQAWLIDLNYRCAQAASRSNAYDSMVRYCESALSLADATWWSAHYDQDFQVNRLYAEGLFLTMRRPECTALLEALLEKATTKRDKASILRLKSKHYQTEGEYPRALETAIEAIGLLGVKLPSNPSRFEVNTKLIYVHTRLKIRGFDRFAEQLPELSDQNIRAVFEILSDIVYVIHWVPGNMLPYVAVESVRLMLKYGYHSSVGIWLTLYAITSHKFFRQTETTFKIWSQAEKLIERTDNKYVAGICFEQRAKFLNHLRFPYSQAQAYYRKALELALESGNVMAELLSLLNIATNSCYEEQPIAESNAAYTHVLARVKQMEDAHMRSNIEFKMCVYSNYAHPHDGSEKELQARYQKALGVNFFITAIMNQFMAQYHFFAGEHEKAIAYHEQWYKDAKLVRFLCDTIISKAYFALSIRKVLPKADPSGRRLLSRTLATLTKDVHKMGRESPENTRHFSLLLDALSALDRNELSRAIELFDAANASAHESRLLLSLGVINEMAGEALYNSSLHRFSKDYLEQAHRYYRRYGMTLKTQVLESRYPELLRRNSGPGSDALAAKNIVAQSASSSSFDFLALVKASQAISVEISSAKLIETMLHVVLEHAGAKRAVFIQRAQGGWTVTAQISQEGELRQVHLLDQALTNYGHLPSTLVNYSIRSSQLYVFNADVPDNQYDYDPYLQERGIRSALCLPIVHLGDALGVLYLESDLISGAFNQERITAMQALTSQIAISLKNSRHVEELERHQRSTERFVPKQLLKLLSKSSADEIQLGDGTKHRITVMFNDIRNFTSHLEHREPEDAFGFVNRYWKFMAPLIRKHNGFIDSFQGDAILALFPLSPDGAVDAGHEMLKALRSFNRQQKALGQNEVDIGIGINTGDAMLGIIGEEERLGTGVISDVTNAAARIESLNKLYGTHFLLSEQSYQSLSGASKQSYRRVDKVVLKGKQAKTYIYELIDWEESLQDISLEKFLGLFASAFEDYERGDFLAARGKFVQCLDHSPTDGVSALLLGRCDAYLDSGTPDDWDGTSKLQHK